MLGRYIRWLHTGWPAGTVERLPESEPDGRTRVPGVRLVGDLMGVPLLKFSADSGARAVEAILAEPDFVEKRGGKDDPERLDLAIVGAGVSGIAAALEAKRAGLRFVVYEAAQEWNTIQNFPKHKPIFTYPTEMVPAGQLKLTAKIKEALLEELEAQRRAAKIEVTSAHVERIERKGGELLVHHDGAVTRALRVIVGIGRSGNYRELGCEGEHLDKVYHRLYDPLDYAGQKVLVVGGGDSAVESAVALALAGAEVTLSYRKKELARPKPENVEKLRALEHDPAADVQIENPSSERVSASMTVRMRATKPGSVRLLLGSKLSRVTASAVELQDGDGAALTLPNDVVFAMIGREAPLDFFRRSGIPIRGEWRASSYAGFAAFLAFCFFLYNWKAGGAINQAFHVHHWFPYNLPESFGASHFSKIAAITLRQPGFYYSFAYCVCVALFGWRRIQRRKTPYVTRQTLALIAFQIIPLFLIPYFILPYAGATGAFDHGFGKTVADHLFPVCNYDYGREYWRAFGFILAWPLFIWNFFTPRPMTWWLVIGLIQTFVIIPLIVRRWGKGAYCGFICSCGALAETLGDRQRTKMPHGPRWNRVNLVGQGVLLFALVLFIARVASWYFPMSALGASSQHLYDRFLSNNTVFGIFALDYYHLVDIGLAGIVGVGCYFWLSGRVWCRFACPLAALMHIYARFSRFRIFAEKKKCISCNICTSVCHQGIDVMAFANKGLPMQDPECVRCSACVQSCPTGVLTFGRLDSSGAPLLDTLPASPVQIAEDGKAHLRIAS
ncbi:MAG TPA: NAD(P)-binding domain-containing protein [Polyangia bacterium]